jgi:hypothetical protein
MLEKYRNNGKLKFSFGKATEFSHTWAKNMNASCMFDDNFGLSIPDYLSLESKLRGVFNIIMKENGLFLFNLSGVNLLAAKKGFTNFDEAYASSMITEWELNMIVSHQDYILNTIFHNGSNELVLTSKKGMKIKWN